MFFYLIFLIELLLLFLLSRTLTQSLSKLFYKLLRSQKLAINLLAVIFLPGVIIHELSHLLTAGILFVPTGDIEFMPKIKEKGEVKLGSVGIGKTDPIRRAIVGVAPFFVGMIIILGLISIFLSNKDCHSVLDTESIWILNQVQNDKTCTFANLLPFIIGAVVLYFIFVISNTMFSSRKDLEGIIELAAVFIIFLAILFIVGFRPPQLVWDYLFSQKAVSAVGRIDLLLLIPLGIDVSVIGVTKFITK